VSVEKCDSPLSNTWCRIFYVTIYRAGAVTKEQIDVVHKELLIKAATRTFPKFDLAMSDAAASIFEESLLDLLNLQREMMGFPKLRG
jgi:hypothetical protein